MIVTRNWRNVIRITEQVGRTFAFQFHLGSRFISLTIWIAVNRLFTGWDLIREIQVSTETHHRNEQSEELKQRTGCEERIPADDKIP